LKIKKIYFFKIFLKHKNKKNINIKKLPKKKKNLTIFEWGLIMEWKERFYPSSVGISNAFKKPRKHDA
jgi:hypothetical protein